LPPPPPLPAQVPPGASVRSTCLTASPPGGNFDNPQDGGLCRRQQPPWRRRLVCDLPGESDPSRFGLGRISCGSRPFSAPLPPPVLQMKPGYTYLIGADSYAVSTMGPYGFNVTLVPGCTPQCDGAFCGDSGCPGFSCGACAADER
jgi:hypothetical protein